MGSKGPGVSMEAKVVARMKGGDSRRIGGTSEGMVMMRLSLMNFVMPAKVLRKDASSSAGGGWSAARSAITCSAVLPGDTRLATSLNAA